MVQFRFVYAMSLITALLLQHWVLNAIGAQEAIPETPAGTCLSGFLDAVNHPDETTRIAFLREGFEKNDDATIKKRKMQTEMIRSQLGKLTIKRVVRTSENGISAICATSNGVNVVLTIGVTDKEPCKIKSVQMELSGDDEEGSVDAPLDANLKSNVIERLAAELRSKYVYPEVGEEMASALEKSISSEQYDDVQDAPEFALRLSKQLLEICHDKHLRVRAGKARQPGGSPGRRPVDNHGFVKAEMLPSGIGYLKFNYFSGEKEAQATASAAMNFLGNSNTLVFDLRDNGGGSPEMIAYLSSYLFDEPVHLNSFYNRPTDTTTETWTQKVVPGKKFSPETQVFVLTSSYTFSGAEEFSYNLKNLKRGTIVGETTGGGAHPVMPVSLGEQMYITMPFARAINPITETNWEGVGVQPDVEVAADQALDKAIELAMARAAELALKQAAEMEKTETADIDVAGLAEEAAELMAEMSYGKAAQAFGKLTERVPNDGRAWLNYGYCLHANGDLDKAIEIHKKASEFDQFAGIATYNLACAYSLKNQFDDALATLEKAIELGFGDVAQLNGDSDFDNLRKDKRYAEIIAKLKGDR